jgi:phospholipase C
MSPGLDNLRHIVVLMMENRSFDHMLGSLKAVDSRIDGITDDLGNPDTTGALVKPQPLAQFQGQLDPDPDLHFPGVDLQIFGGDLSPNRVPNMQGFVKSYFTQRRDVGHSQKIMYYFKKDDLPVLTTLALEFAVFNRWFSSIPGPTICNRAFAHYGTSFGRVDMNPFDIVEPFKSIYARLVSATPQHTAKVYYYDSTSSTMEGTNLLQHQPQLFGTYRQFLDDCDKGLLPDYSFVEPNYNDHETDIGEEIANDQHPDHDVQAGEFFIADVYMALKRSPLWPNTALLIVYAEHGGIYDHVVPPACTADRFTARANSTGTGMEFKFDRLGVRVPAILVSPWIPRGTVVDRVFDHASIPATITKFFLGDYSPRSPREINADVFIEPNARAADPARNLLSLAAMRRDCPEFAHVPRPKKSAMNPDRPVNALILAQIRHLQTAEKNLPLRYRSEKYINAIQTEGEAAEYIREVTEAIHQAHSDAATGPAKRVAHQKEGLRIAVAAERPSRKRTAADKGKRKAAKRSPRV